jgi:hypothetical protein
MRPTVVLIMAFAALGLAVTDAQAESVIDLPATGKITLDGKCAAAGGTSYQTQQGGGYGCAGKGGNTVECDPKGACKGYIKMEVVPGLGTVGNLDGMTLQMLGATEGEPAGPAKLPKAGLLGTSPNFAVQKPSATGTPGAPPPPPPPPAKSETIY